MKKRGPVLAAVALAGILAFGSAATVLAGGGEKKPSGEMANVQYLTATVEKIDHATRMVTLKGPEGNTVTFRVSDEARNLDKVKAGDTVNVKYYEAVAWQVMKPGSVPQGVSTTAVKQRAAKGEMPQGVMGTQTTVIAEVEAIDKDKKHVTLKGPHGNSERVAIRNPKNLENVKVGDQVELTYTEAVAISVTPAAPGKMK